MESKFTFDIVLQRNRHSCGGADTDWIDCPIHEESCSALACWDCNYMEKDCEGMELSFLANVHGGGEWIVTDSSGAILGKFENQDDAQDWIDEQ